MCETARGLLSSGPFASEHQTVAMLPPAVADHHLHIQTPEAGALLLEQFQQSASGFEGIHPALFESRGVEDALRVLDLAGIRKGLLLSEAYVFESPFARARNVDSKALTRQENAFNVAAAIRSNGRLLACIGVNPLAAGAIEELSYWSGREGVAGVKVHLGNSDFDSQSAEQIRSLSTFFEHAGAVRMPIVIHVKSPRDPRTGSARLFIDQVLPRAEDLPVQIAHAGGGGGLDDSVLDGLRAYADAIRRSAPGTKHLFFDLAVVGVLPHTDAGLAQRLLLSLAGLIRDIGVDRFVMGSDWPSLCAPAEHNAILQSQIPLTVGEWSRVLNNQAAYWSVLS